MFKWLHFAVLEKILAAGEDKNESKNWYTYPVEAYGGIKSIEKLTRHEQAEINQRAVVPQHFNVSKRKYYI